MEEIAGEVRKLVYTVICLQCLLQVSAGNAYQKYLKFFSYLLTLSVCCSIVISFVGKAEDNINQADVLYERWYEEWQKYNIEEEEKDVREMAQWYEENFGEQGDDADSVSEWDTDIRDFDTDG